MGECDDMIATLAAHNAAVRRRAERLELASRIQVAIVGGYWSDSTTEPYISTDDRFPAATKETARIAVAHADALLDALVARPEDK